MGLFNIFSSKSKKSEAEPVRETTERPPVESSPMVSNDIPEESPYEELERRKLVFAKVLQTSEHSPVDSDQLIIKAQIARDKSETKFMLNRDLLSKRSWWFGNQEEAEQSELVSGLFEIEGVAQVMVINSSLIVYPTQPYGIEWEDWAKQIGAKIRSFVESGKSVLPDEVTNQIPSEESITKSIQEIIDGQINPGIAAHEGYLTLQKVEGNTVYITMGGGCQGCSSAGDTLKYGIISTFREQVPFLGAVLDETEHRAGENPFMREMR